MTEKQSAGKQEKRDRMIARSALILCLIYGGLLFTPYREWVPQFVTAYVSAATKKTKRAVTE